VKPIPEDLMIREYPFQIKLNEKLK
jgi:hypothetical protein